MFQDKCENTLSQRLIFSLHSIAFLSAQTGAPIIYSIAHGSLDEPHALESGRECALDLSAVLDSFALRHGSDARQF